MVGRGAPKDSSPSWDSNVTDAWIVLSDEDDGGEDEDEDDDGSKSWIGTVTTSSLGATAMYVCPNRTTAAVPFDGDCDATSSAQMVCYG